MRSASNEIRIGGLAGMLALPLTILGVLLLAQVDFDLRVGPFPWIAAAVAVLLLVCLNALRQYHAGNDTLLLRISVVLTGIGLIGMLALFGGIAVSAAVGVNEGPLILVGVLIVSVMAAIGLPIGLALLGIAELRQRVLPKGIRGVPLLLAALIPIGMLVSGFADGTAEIVVQVVWFVGFAVGWAAVGYALWTVRATSHHVHHL